MQFLRPVQLLVKGCFSEKNNQTNKQRRLLGLGMLTFVHLVILFVYLCFQNIPLYESFHYLLLGKEK